jgi:hypothetical protein
VNGERLNGAGSSSAHWADGRDAWRVGGSTPGVPAAATADAMGWTLGYERATVDRYLADTEAECARLRSEIEVARAQRDAARQVIAARERDAQAELGALVVEFEREMSELEAAHRAVIQTIRDAAESEAARVRAAAEREVAALREMALTLAPLVSGRGARERAGASIDLRGADRPSTRDRVGAG